MKKTFPLHSPGKADARVLDAIKHEVRKYVKRERSKPLPEGFRAWSFQCFVGSEPAASERKELKEVSAAIDAVAQAGGDGVYVRIDAVPEP